MIIGLTGSIAMGKSEVAKIFKSLGIPVFDADATVHEIYEDGTAAKALATLCPEAISGTKVDRKILSGLIAQNPNLLKSVTDIIHPLVHRAEQEFRLKYKDQIAVIDSPLILETGKMRDMDVLIVVSASAENQMARALTRQGMTIEKFEFIKSRQMPDDEKRGWAHYIIENDGTLEDLAIQTTAIIENIRERENLHA